MRGQPTVVFIEGALEKERSMIHEHISTTRITICYIIQQTPVGSLTLQRADVMIFEAIVQ